MFQTQSLVYDTRMEQTQGLGQIQLLRLTANKNVVKLAKAIAETAFEV